MADLQVNVVLMRGVNDDEIPDFVELTRHKPINVRFIEYMPFDGNVWSDSKMLPYRDMIRAVENCTLQQLQRLEVRSQPIARRACTACLRYLIVNDVPSPCNPYVLVQKHASIFGHNTDSPPPPLLLRWLSDSSFGLPIQHPAAKC